MLGDLQRALGVNLRRHREREGLSQEAFADVLGVHRTYAGALERGERNISLQGIERIATKIGAEPLALLQPAPQAQTSAELPSAQRRSAQ